MQIYLDNAATTPLRAEVKERFNELINGPFGNPSSIHQFGRKTRALIEDARSAVAKSLHCSPGEIVFTSGGTEADNIALQVAVRDLGVERIITSPIEHPAVLRTAEGLAKKYGVKLELLNIDKNGVVDLGHLEDLLRKEVPTLVSLMHGNNEIGNLLDIKKAGTLVKQYGAYFHSDTVQTIGHYNLDVNDIPVDFMAASAHKFYGPKGAGFLYVKSSVKTGPLIFGGGQERGMRSGTENSLGLAAMQTALQTSLDDLEQESAHILKLKKHLMGRLKSHFPGVIFNGMSGDVNHSLYTVLSAGFPDIKDDGLLLFKLDMKGLAASGGSACSSGSQKASHVMEALGNSGFPVIRFSFGIHNTIEEMDRTAEILKEVSEA